MPPQLGKIEQKLREKDYTFAGPLELIAYSQHDEPDGHINSLGEIRECIDQNLPDSLFSRCRFSTWDFCSTSSRCRRESTY
jgi:hypothetical protein